MEIGRDRFLDNRESLRRGDDTSSNNTPQSTTSRLDNSLPVLHEPPDLQEAVSRHTRNASNAEFLERKRSYVRQELEGAKAEYDKCKKIKDKFPVPADLAQREKVRLENEYNAIKREESKAKAAEEVSAANLTKLLRETLKAKDEELKQKDDRYDVLSTQVAAMQRELQDLLAQQAKPAAQPPPVPKELQNRIHKLEEFRDKQKSENVVFKAMDNTLKQNLDNLRADHLKKHEESGQQVNELRQEQRKLGQDTTQTSSSLRSELEALQQRTEPLERRLPSIESQLRASESQRTTEKEIFQQIQEASAAQQRTADDTERLRRSIHLKVETLSGEFKDGISNMKTDLRSVNSQVSDVRQNYSKLAGKVDSLESPDKAGGSIPAAFESEIKYLQKVDQDQLEKLAALDTSVEEIDAKVSSLTTHLNQFSAAIEELRALQTQLTANNSAWKNFEERASEEIKTIQQQVVDPMTNRLSSDDTTTSEKVETIRSQLEEFATRQDKLNDDIKLLATQVSEQGSEQSTTIKGLQMEFTRYTEARTASEEQRDLTLMDEIAKVRREFQQDQLIVRAALAQRPTHGLSHDERLQIQKLEVQIDALQKLHEKHSHILASLNHRFSTLTTETLARQMMGVANKALPKFEQALRKVESEVQELRDKLATSANGVPPEVEKSILSIQESVVSLETSLLGKHDTLAKNFIDGRDQVVKKLEELEESAARHETDQSTYRESTARNFKTFETRLDNVNAKIEDTDDRMKEIPSRRELFPRKDRAKAYANNQAVSGNNRVQGPSSVSVSGVVQGSDDDDDDDNEVNRQDLLQRFDAGTAPRRGTPRQSVRHGHQPNSASSKRKRSESQEKTNDFEFSIKGRSSKGTRH